MPTISFYILPSASQEERFLFACKLLEKAFRNRQACYALTDNEKQCVSLDDMLWTFRAGSFVPHQIYDGNPPQSDNAVLIGTKSPPKAWGQTVVNLSTRLPDDLEGPDKIMEILDNDGTVKDLGRNRYRHYQQLGMAITVHKL